MLFDGMLARFNAGWTERDGYFNNLFRGVSVHRQREQQNRFEAAEDPNNRTKGRRCDSKVIQFVVFSSKIVATTMRLKIELDVWVR